MRLFCFAWGAASAAWADPVHVLPEFPVIGRQEYLIGEALSASEGYVSQADLAGRPLPRTGEILEVVPGMVVTQHSGTGKANQYFLRGFNLDHATDFAIFVDGMPVNQVSHAHGQGYADLNFLIPETVDHVRYAKGPYHAAVGDFSSAGSAQFQTVRALDRGLAAYTAGLNDYHRILLADSFAVSTDASLLAAGDYTTYAGPWDVGEDLRQAKALLKYSATRGFSRYAVSFMAYDARWNGADQIPLRAVESGLISDLGYVDPTVGGRTSRFSLAANFARDTALTSVAANIFAIRYDLDLWSNFTYLLDDPVAGDQFEQSEERWTFGGSAAHAWNHVHVGAFHARHTVGTQVRYDTIRDLGLFRTRERERLSTVRLDDVDELSAALFYEGEVRWTDALRTTLGLRFDGYAFDVSSDLPANSGDATDSLLSPKLGAVYTVSPALEVYANAGYGFHSNDARGTTITVDPTDPSGSAPADAVDPLVPSFGAEAGVRVAWDETFHATFTVWWLELDSELLYIGDAGATEATIGSERYGLEWANHWRALPWLSLDLDLALTDSRLENGDEIPGAIATVVTGGVHVDSDFGFSGALRGRYFGPRPLVEDGSVESDGSFVVNLRLAQEVLPELVLHVEVLNLLDSDDHDITYFYESRLPGEPADGVADIHFHRLEPITVRAGLTWRF